MRERMTRLNKYMAYRGLNDNQVTLQCGLSQGLLGQARSGKSDLGPKTVEKILNIYQDLNRVWLLTGEGEMLIENSSGDTLDVEQSFDLVPLIPVGVHAGSFSDYSPDSIDLAKCEKVVSPVQGCDLAIDVTGDSMEPDFPNGCRVFVRRINDSSFIAWGNVFVLDTENGAFIKKVYPGDGSTYIEARSINPDYPTFNIPTSSIYGVYRVLMMARGYSAS